MYYIKYTYFNTLLIFQRIIEQVYIAQFSNINKIWGILLFVINIIFNTYCHKNLRLVTVIAAWSNLQVARWLFLFLLVLMQTKRHIQNLMITQNFEPTTPSNLLQVIQVNKWARKQEKKKREKRNSNAEEKTN